MADVAHILHGWNQLWWVRVLAYVTTAAVLVITALSLAACRRVTLTLRQRIAAVCFVVLIVDEVVLLYLGSSDVFISALNLVMALALQRFVRQLRRRATAV